MCPCTSTNGLPWPGQREPGVQRVDQVQGARGTRRSDRASSRSRSTARSVRARGRRRSAAAARPGTGRRATARARASRSAVHTPRSVSIVDPGHERAVGLDHPRDPRGDVLRPLGVRAPAPPRARRSGARSRAVAPAPPPGRSARRDAVRRGWGASTSRTRRGRRSSPPDPSGRCGHACRRAAGRAPRPGRPGPRPARARASEPGSCIPVSTRTIPDPGGDRPRVAVRDTRQRQRQSQPPQPGDHALSAPELATARHAPAPYWPAYTAPLGCPAPRCRQAVLRGDRARATSTPRSPCGRPAGSSAWSASAS